MSEGPAGGPSSIRVLVAEDEALIARLIRFLLEDAGIASKVVHSGECAVEAIKEEPTGFQVLVTDIRLGHPPDGWDVARAARLANPSIGVLYITGDSMANGAVEDVSDSLLLSKPFRITEVLSAIMTLAQRASTPSEPRLTSST